MNHTYNLKILTTLYRKTFNNLPAAVEKIPRSGSDRVYFRMRNGNHSTLGAFNPDVNENEAFFSFSKTFSEAGINVPEILAISTCRKYYLLTDLGTETLAGLILTAGSSGLTENQRSPLCLLKKAITGLLKLQLAGANKIDFSKCWPRDAFDRQSIMWDLNYFKYNFLKLTGITFNEQALDDDFKALADFLLQAPSDYFMYRDFQPANIMVVGNEPWFIDYQGGRKGSLQYDLASLLYSPKTKLNETQRDVLLGFYLNQLQTSGTIKPETFLTHFYAFVLMRILQALGAYGFRGIFQQKPNFKKSIPVALSNLKTLLKSGKTGIELPEIERVIHLAGNMPEFRNYDIPAGILTVRVISFSFKNRIPEDPSGNGGGFVFDCRGLPNPGRMKEFSNQNGLDPEVINYLEQFPEVKQFQENARNAVKSTINNYLVRGFNHLCISFGCTGGQHRSVYQAKSFAGWLKNTFPVNVILEHANKKHWQTEADL
ncbi:MAG: phosphotransferase [Prolixibacteraceae bacterium]|nr:phosphotransferase [Prolixibacteraceae bacterium]